MVGSNDISELKRLEDYGLNICLGGKEDMAEVFISKATASWELPFQIKRLLKILFYI